MARFLNSKRNENLADSTLDKLTTIFEKQFLAWATSYGFTLITAITTADLEDFRDTWTGSSPIPLFCWVESEQMVLLRITSLRPSSTKSWTQLTSISSPIKAR